MHFLDLLNDIRLIRFILENADTFKQIMWYIDIHGGQRGEVGRGGKYRN